MGFSNFDADIDESDSSSSSGSSSSSSSSNSTRSSTSRSTGKGLSLPAGTESDDFPVYTVASPYAVIREKSDGTHEFVANTGMVSVEMKKDWYSAPWEYADRQPGEWARVFWTEQSFRTFQHRVEHVTGEDLRSVCASDADKALTLMRQAATEYEKDAPEWSSHVSCAVCGEHRHVVQDEFERVNNRPVCSHHAIEDVIQAGVLDD